ncbi:MAG: hypothetical protein LUO89_11320 [Methanothrix sp.]|nr:hypothetical protein [Methanothrix sp.]
MSSNDGSELTYEDVDEDGRVLYSTRARPAWQLVSSVPEPALCHSFMRICGNRKYFGDKSERSRWKKIANGIKRGHIPIIWVMEKYTWAKEMNKDGTKIIFSAVLNAILNTEKMKDWKAKREADVIIEGMRGADVIVSEHD